MEVETQQTTQAQQAPAAQVAAPSPIQQVPAVPAASPAQTVSPPPAAATPNPGTSQSKEPVNEAPAFGEATTYQPTGNSNLDTALKWAGSLGLDIDRCPEMKEAANGNFGPLRALLASKQIPGSEAYIALAEAGFKETQAQQQAKEQDVQRIVVEAAGGADQWAEVFNWASEHAEQAEKDQINYAFEQGGFLAEAVAATLVANYRQQTGVTVPPQGVPAQPTAGAQPTGTTHGPLSPQAYTQAVQKLRQSLGGKELESSPEYANLQRRRMAYRG